MPTVDAVRTARSGSRRLPPSSAARDTPVNAMNTNAIAVSTPSGPTTGAACSVAMAGSAGVPAAAADSTATDGRSAADGKIPTIITSTSTTSEPATSPRDAPTEIRTPGRVQPDHDEHRDDGDRERLRGQHVGAEHTGRGRRGGAAGDQPGDPGQPRRPAPGRSAGRTSPPGRAAAGRRPRTRCTSATSAAATTASGSHGPAAAAAGANAAYRPVPSIAASTTATADAVLRRRIGVGTAPPSHPTRCRRDGAGVSLPSRSGLTAALRAADLHDRIDQQEPHVPQPTSPSPSSGASGPLVTLPRLDALDGSAATAAADAVVIGMFTRSGDDDGAPPQPGSPPAPRRSTPRSTASWPRCCTRSARPARPTRSSRCRPAARWARPLLVAVGLGARPDADDAPTRTTSAAGAGAASRALAGTAHVGQHAVRGGRGRRGAGRPARRLRVRRVPLEGRRVVGARGDLGVHRHDGGDRPPLRAASPRRWRTARSLVNTPPSALYPETFAARAAELAEAAGLTVEVLDDAALARGRLRRRAPASARAPRASRAWSG